MGIYFSSSNEGSLRSVSEKFAFPNDYANESYDGIVLENVEGVYFYKLKPNSSKYSNIGLKRAIIFLHGNAMVINKQFVNLFNTIMSKFNASEDVYMMEYPGYGFAKRESNNTPSADSCSESLNKLIESISSEYDEIYIVAHSIGTGVATKCIHENNHAKVKGMILISPYKSILDVVFDNDLIKSTFSSFNFYNNHEKLGNNVNNTNVNASNTNVNASICLIHGLLDNVIPYTHSQDIFSKIKGNKKNKLYLIDADHNNIIGLYKTWEIIFNFIHN